MIIATRAFESASGNLVLTVSSTDLETPAFAYRLVDDDGAEVQSLTVHGADTVQALLFCLTAAGDYVQRFAPSASFLETGVHGLPTTDLDAAGEWRAVVGQPLR